LTPGATAAPGSGSVTGNGLLQDLESFLEGIAGNLTGTAGNELVQVTNNLIEDVVSAIGIQQWYSLYMTKYCEGGFTPNYADADAKRNVSACKSLSKSTRRFNLGLGWLTGCNSSVKFIERQSNTFNLPSRADSDRFLGAQYTQ
jgi:hypothetical protein